MKQKSFTTDICAYCGKEYSRREVKRSLGGLSPVLSGGYCSAACYTKVMIKEPQTPPTSTEYVIRMDENDLNTVLAALVMAKTRYNTTDNGGIFMDFSFPNEEKQNEYAQNFETVENKIRNQDAGLTDK